MNNILNKIWIFVMLISKWVGAKVEKYTSRKIALIAAAIILVKWNPEIPFNTLLLIFGSIYIYILLDGLKDTKFGK